MVATKSPAKKSKIQKIVRKQSKPVEAKTPSKAAQAVVTIDRRAAATAERRVKGASATVERRVKGESATVDRRVKSEPVAVERRVLERRAKVSRRRQIDPTTCERDYSPEEVEFMSAMDDYKRRSGRMFPTCSEVLEVVKKLGYCKAFTQPLMVEATPVSAMLETAGSTTATSVLV